jgi:hypothetical protein
VGIAAQTAADASAQIRSHAATSPAAAADAAWAAADTMHAAAAALGSRIRSLTWSEARSLSPSLVPGLGLSAWLGGIWEIIFSLTFSLSLPQPSAVTGR